MAGPATARPGRRGTGRWLLRRSLALAALLAGTGTAAWAGGVSNWTPSQHSAVRLIDAGQRVPGDPAGGRWAAVEVRLDPSFITYWRTPGEAGVAPVFDFGSSENLRAADVLYPAPRRFDEDGLAAFGYDGDVTFPVKVDPQDPSRPVTIVVEMAYAVCARICLPATAGARLSLGGDTPTEAAKVVAALAEVPQSRAMGQAGPIRIDAVDAVPDGAVVRATTPDGAGALFAEAPEPWFVMASMPRSLGAGRLEFTLKVLDHPAGAVPHAPLRLTLVGAGSAIETSVPLDEILPKP